MTRFEERLDDWPALHVARALLELDEIERYLLLLYAHGLHHSAWARIFLMNKCVSRLSQTAFAKLWRDKCCPAKRCCR